MSVIVTSRKQIPDALFYVLSNDKFMSGWGPAAGKINTLIFPCRDRSEAEIVAENARRRTDQERVRIKSTKPKMRPGVLYSLMSREEAPRWYKLHAWSGLGSAVDGLAGLFGG